MKKLQVLMALSAVAIYVLTVIATTHHGFNWPAVAIEDLLSLNWRSQFDFDFIIHLLLLATWVVWREGATARAYVFGSLSVIMGGMFSFPYIVYAIYAAKGEPKSFLLGVNSSKSKFTR